MNDFKFFEKIGVEEKLNLFMTLYSKMITVPEDGPWLAVESAFGGTAIYRKECLLLGTYNGISENGNEVCEHFSLNRAISTTGKKIFINPKFITTGINEHNKRALDYILELKANV
jgi:GTP-dependent phosphoenolpyruvate carboxykinase